jgi:hypothetical protein
MRQESSHLLGTDGGLWTPTSPVRVNPSVPAERERIISKALEKDRKVGYQNAAGLRANPT